MQPQYEFSQSEGFSELLRTLLNPELYKQDYIVGVTIDFHPLWWALYSNWHEWGGIDAFDLPRRSGWPPLGMPRRLIPRPDLTWTGDYWEYVCRDYGKDPDPFIVKLRFAPETDAATRARLRDLARQQRFFCLAEERPIATAASSFDGGGDIKADEPGTLGVYLLDRNTSKTLGITCAHVAQTQGIGVSGDDSLGVSNSQLGTVKETAFHQLSALAPGQGCNRTTITLQGAKAAIPAVDAAIVELSSGHSALKTIQSIGTIDAIYDRTQFGSGDQVEMRGAKSKHNSYIVGAYDAVYKVLFNDGRTRCFEHMFEINRQSLASSFVPPVLAAKPVHGDSGASICCPSSTGNFAYCGTLVAVDGTTGYACFAESVRDWAKTLSPGIDLAPL